MVLSSLASVWAEVLAPLPAQPATVVGHVVNVAQITVTSPAFWAGMAGGLALAVVALCVARNRRPAARREATEARASARQLDYERDLAQQALVQKREQERELVREKMQFESQLTEFEKYASFTQLALGAAHEINNPLLGILSHLELELRGASGEQQTEVEQCIEGARRISSAVHGLLDYARPGPLTLTQVSLPQLVDDALRFVEHQPLFRGIQLQNCVPLDLPEITADANQLSQILMNLLLNAAQATPAGGSITVLADKMRFEDTVELRIRDTGTGIPEDVQPHVFEPFFTTKRGRGTGLGLSITRNYVKRHGGEIRLNSIPGNGTTVCVTLPIHQAGQLEPVSTEVIS
jgi:signal transduction histidine kinase